MTLDVTLFKMTADTRLKIGAKTVASKALKMDDENMYCIKSLNLVFKQLGKS